MAQLGLKKTNVTDAVCCVCVVFVFHIFFPTLMPFQPFLVDLMTLQAGGRQAHGALVPPSSRRVLVCGS